MQQSNKYHYRSAFAKVIVKVKVAPFMGHGVERIEPEETSESYGRALN